jgi:hypothetical protein
VEEIILILELSLGFASPLDGEHNDEDVKE